MTEAPRRDPALTAESTSGDPRADRVAAAVRTWQRSLVDLGGRNTLLWYRDLPSGTLDLTTAHPGGVSMLLAGRRTRLSDLFREPAALDEARRRARAIRSKALELREERGIAAGFVAIGMATWSVPRAARPPAAPVLLRACVLRPTGAAQDDFEIDLGPEVEFNPVLREYLRSEQGIEVDGDALADLATGPAGFDARPVYEALGRQCAHVPGLDVADRIVLGTFSYAKLPMVADLALQGGSLADHDVVAALAGDESALAAVRLRVPDSEPDPDPEHEYLVLDADSSQHAAIDAVRAGAHLVVKGPPGTGKSQTIANLIAALAAEGKSTLFVAEKRAAIDAVLTRLDRLGLGDLVLDAYDGTTNKRATALQFGRSLDAALQHTDAPTDGTGAELRDRRARLQRHLRALHEVREPWGVSAHDAEEALVELGMRKPPPTSRVRVVGRELSAISRTRSVELGRRLRDAAGLGAWVREGGDPWFGARILSGDDASRALEITTRYSTTGLDDTGSRLNGILDESQVPAAESINVWASAFETMSRVRETLEVFRPEVFDTPLREHISATATRDWREARGVEMGWMDRWRIRRQTKRLLRPGRPPADLHDRLVAASEQREHWYALVGGGGRPEISPRLDEGLALLASVKDDLDWLDGRLPQREAQPPLTDLPLDDLRERLAALAARPDRVGVLPQVTSILDEMRAAGLGPLVDDLARRGVGTEQVTAEVDHVWWASLAQEVTVRDPAYGAHDGAGLRRDVAEYVEADRAHQDATVARVRDAVARNVREVLDDHPAQEALVRAEAGKARRHKPLRDLVPQASAALTAIKPCWAMSPLVVASTLPPGKWFDVVVFDEASQVQPAQAISAISRARQVVVAGDERQLPPTNFFTVVSDDETGPTEADDTLTEGFESVLDVLAATLPTRSLTWHYRSRDERLIAFANDAVYDGGLTTFPGTSIESAVTFEPVDGQATLQPGVDTIETTDAEVVRVVELVLEHARTRPSESLGVIALGIKHADRLDDAVTDALRRAPDVADFFDADRPERFFVKNLERVQGDERDAVILSIGYGKTPHGRVLHRFGPLNIEGGERRLNVAVTRARQRMTVVSALRASDLDPERLKARGAVMLRDFLAYAETGGRRGDDGTLFAASPPTGDPLRRDLAERLRREGLTVHEDYGSASQRIDLAVEDPYHRGRGLIAVETDGDRYAALRSTRDRDRLRPEQLARLGWIHERVWSTDVFRDPAREISRIVTIARETRVPEPDPGPTALSQDAPMAPTPTPAGTSGNGPAADGPTAAGQGNDAGGDTADDMTPAGTGADATANGEPRRRKRRRVFRRGTADTAADDPVDDLAPAPAGARSSDDTDLGWGGARGEDSDSRDQWLQDQRPPHYE
ncbi:AAA domain-containing protein [Intrasporangium sp. YIM S08009]|uniref:AAA domain-containing protein n=1 Tax=Intrasporangium zincisolvens TaxID=3080018 RepID=UPI002B061597|nr:AAA domain-containing protein [Intrasporangium sp. YIM S08009]